MDADVIVVGAGLAGLAATAELADAGRKVLLLDQEPEASLGGQAFWSFGGLLLVDSPEQRRMGIKDSRDLALQDWLGSAGFDRLDDEDKWARQWAEAYVDFAAGEKRPWLHAQGVRFFPVVGWAERGGYNADGHGNSVPRFHITWGTGPGLVAPFERRVRDAAAKGLVEFRFRHRVDELTVTGGVVDGVAGKVLEPSGVERGVASSRTEVGDFSLTAQAVIVTSGGIGGNHDLVRSQWPKRMGDPPRRMISGVPAHVDGRMLAITETGRRPVREPGPDVALHRGHPELGPDLADARDPDPARPVVALVRCHRQAAAGATVPRVRHPGHPRAHHADRLRLHLVRPHPEDHREGVRPLRPGAEPGSDRQGHQGRPRPGPRRSDRTGARVHGEGRRLHRPRQPARPGPRA